MAVDHDSADPARTKAQTKQADSIAEQQPPADLDRGYLLKAYELAERHYEMDLQLFSARMSLFLLVQTGLVAAVGSTLLKSGTFTYGGPISLFGSLLAFAWLLVAASSYCWIKMWRWHLYNLGERLTDKADGVILFSLLFHRDHIKTTHPLKLHRDRRQTDERVADSPKLTIFERFSYYARPTLVTCCLPLLFIGGWIYIGFHVHWSGF
jgi:hypothetical protein